MRFRNLCLALPVLAALLIAGCGDNKKAAAADGRLAVYSGIPPVAYLTSAVGGDRVDSKSVLPEGRSPHDYSPGPQEVRGVTGGKLFFTAGMPFENAVCRAVDPKQTRIVDVTKGIEKIPFEGDDDDDDHDADHGHDAEHHHHDHGAFDPHVWLSMDNAAVIADHIARALTEADPKGAAVYAANLAALKKKLADAGSYAANTLKPYAGREFYVYHPAFGYFAKSVGLKQVGIELGGREVTPAHLAEVIKKAKADKVKVVFVQPQFNPSSARALGDAIGGRVAGLDPLAADIPANVRAMTDALKEGFSAGGKE
jgi:zinc transport system substrate-binding protein